MFYHKECLCLGFFSLSSLFFFLLFFFPRRKYGCKKQGLTLFWWNLFFIEDLAVCYWVFFILTYITWAVLTLSPLSMLIYKIWERNTEIVGGENKRNLLYHLPKLNLSAYLLVGDSIASWLFWWWLEWLFYSEKFVCSKKPETAISLMWPRERGSRQYNWLTA